MAAVYNIKNTVWQKQNIWHKQTKEYRLFKLVKDKISLRSCLS